MSDSMRRLLFTSLYNNCRHTFKSNSLLSNFSRAHHRSKSTKFNYRRMSRITNSSLIASTSLIFAWGIGSYCCLASNDNNTNTAHGSQVFTWGFNRYGQLGVGSETNEGVPTSVDAFVNEEIIFISCGEEQTACITKDGKLFTFGRAEDARLGHGETSGANETYPRQIMELDDERVVHCDAGYLHMACVTDDGAVYTWGKNSYHQLGHNNPNFPNCVAKLKEMKVKAVKVACGRYHTAVLGDDGQVYAWGGINSGEAGTGKKRNTPEPTQVTSLNDERVVDISAGQDFTLFLTESGFVYSCGAGDKGQTGLGSTIRRFNETPTKIPTLANVTKIAAGQFHGIACTDAGKVFTWGLNREGQLGHGDTQNRTLPTQCKNVPGKVINVSAGGGHSACLISDSELEHNQVYIFGRGRQGQIGRANNVESVAAYRASPVIVDFFNSLQCNVRQVVLGTNHSAALCCQ